MGVDDNGDLGFQQRGGRLLNCLSSGMYTIPQSEKVVEMTMGSMPMCISSNAIDSFFSSDWDPHVSLEQNVELKGSSMVFHNQIATSPCGIGVRENQRTYSTSHFVQYPSDASLMDLAQKLPCLGSGSFSNMINSFGLPECGQIANAVSPPDYPSKDGGIKKTSMGSRNDIVYGAICQEQRILDEGTGAPSPNERKRKRMPEIHSEFDPFQSKEGKQQKDLSRETLEGPKEIDEKKQKTEQNPGTNLHGKVMGKQAKDHSQSGEASKDDYIHVRAKRGMATNSHSLAERVRREKISERMRFLQDLVPGCNKITGKAVMLDEIINYVQSLQQQVEFLSMKLATVNPELNIDLDQLLSKDILQSRGGSSAIFGFSPGMSTSFLQLHRTPQGATPSIQHANPCLPPMSQVSSVWDDELQSVMQMGFVSSPVVDSLGLNGCTKVEL